DITSGGNCCVIIYEDQLEIAEQRKRMLAVNETQQKKSLPSLFPYAAGIAALSLLPNALSAQETKKENAANMFTSEKTLSDGMLEVKLINNKKEPLCNVKVEVYIDGEKYDTRMTDAGGKLNFSVKGHVAKEVMIKIAESGETHNIPCSGKFLSRSVIVESKQITSSITVKKEKFFIKGKIEFPDKKYKVKAGTVISLVDYSAETENGELFKLMSFTAKAGGNFKIEVSEEIFKRLIDGKEDLGFDTKTRHNVNHEIITTEKNTHELNISIEKRRFTMGAMF
ncbi:MAG TPA: hypothetical protein VNX68_00470, partial [Nitrosopumilaceae archaeon]|nr:hypothetical protein [Nitrosopumilaceae archaeon]